MRSVVVAIAFLLVAGPVLAQSDQSIGHSYGGVNCAPQIPCSEDVDQIMSVIKSCMTQHFGYSSIDGLFDEDMGLDSNNCLTTNADAFPKIASTKTVPHCCMVETSGDQCLMHCDMVGAQ